MQSSSIAFRARSYLARVTQRLRFRGSKPYWERRYATGGSSGEGSYGELAEQKAAFLNRFVADRGIRTVIEFGCGDGNQLSYAKYPEYVGLDVSRTSISLCAARFRDVETMSFFLYDGGCFVDRRGRFRAEMAVSLDVIYHLVEDTIFETYMNHLFDAAELFVVIYSTDDEIPKTAAHVRHRVFTRWVADNRPDWQLIQSPTKDDDPTVARFYVYALAVDEQKTATNGQ